MNIYNSLHRHYKSKHIEGYGELHDDTVFG